MAAKGFFNAFKDVWMLDGVRTPMVDYCGALGNISPTDLGIKAARAALERAGVPGEHIGSVLTGNMAPGDFEQFMLPRHIGLYAGVPQDVPALMAQRICGTGFELFRQAGEQIESGCADVALVVGTENMTRNPICAFDHRTGFKLGAPVGFKDFLWEALNDSTPNMEDTFNQSVLMGMYYKNHGQQAAMELVEANRGGEYTRWKSTPQFNLSSSLLYRAQLPPKYQGGGHLYGIDMKNNSQNSRKTELFFDIVSFVREWGPRKDAQGRQQLNIWFYEYWTQLYNIEVEEKATGAVQFATRNKNAYNDDLVYAVQYAYLCYTCSNRMPTRIDSAHPEMRMVERQKLNPATLELYTVRVAEPVLYV